MVDDHRDDCGVHLYRYPFMYGIVCYQGSTSRFLQRSKQSRNRPWRADVNSVREGAQSSSESSSAQTRRELDILLRDLANPSSHTITSGQPLATVRDNTMGIFYLFEPSVGETGRGISRTRQACITGALRPEPSLASTTTTSVTPLQLFCPYRLQRSFHRF